MRKIKPSVYRIKVDVNCNPPIVGDRLIDKTTYNQYKNKLKVLDTFFSQKQLDTLQSELSDTKEKLRKVVELLKQSKCPDNDCIDGAIPVLEHQAEYVTKDMAIDAGDRSLEGSLYSEEQWSASQCQWCYERDQAISDLEGE